MGHSLGAVILESPFLHDIAEFSGKGGPMRVEPRAELPEIGLLACQDRFNDFFQADPKPEAQDYSTKNRAFI